MSAHPFGGGYPTFSQYLTWAAQTAQCKVQTGYKLTDDGEALSMTLILAPSGRHAIEVDLLQEDRIVPSIIAALDRRLGLKSPWSFSSDDAA